MSSLSLARVCYRGLLRGTKRLETQLVRHGSPDVFTEAECLTLKELIPGYKTALNASSPRTALNSLIGDEFRVGAALDLSHKDQNDNKKHSSSVADEIDRRLDDAIAGYALLNRRLSLLETMAAEPSSDTITDGIRVTAQSALVPEMSSPRDDNYVFQYSIVIKNESREEPVQVVSRHWVISDEEGHTEEVRGHGVVGYQPVLDQGTEFSYTSQAPLRRLKGSMKGSYTLVGQTSGKLLEAAVGAFSLCPPRMGPTGGSGGVGRKGKGRRGGGGGRGSGEKDNAGDEEEEVARVAD